MKNKYVVLLTACVNPGNMVNTVLKDADTRRKQYIEALEFYLTKMDYPIVFVENTQDDFSNLFKMYIDLERLEYITFQGNNHLYCNRGKGYGEAVILDYALRHSRFLQKYEYVVKITGRLKLLNLKSILGLHRYILPVCDIHCKLDVKAQFADSRLLISKVAFLQFFLERKEVINDDFECVLYKCIDEQTKFICYPLFIRPSWIGTSGTVGDNYWTGEYLSLKLDFLHKMLEYCIIYNKNHDHNSSFFVNSFLKFLSLLVKMVLGTFRWWKDNKASKME